MTMEVAEFESTNLAGASYYRPDAALEITFKSGSRYRYANVPVDKWYELLNAESHGKYFSAEIRNNFCYEKLPDALKLKVLVRLDCGCTIDRDGGRTTCSRCVIGEVNRQPGYVRRKHQQGCPELDFMSDAFEYVMRWPDYCRVCRGTGMQTWREPHGEWLGDICGCIVKGCCPRCGKAIEMVVTKDADYFRCLHCFATDKPDLPAEHKLQGLLIQDGPDCPCFGVPA